MPPPRIYIPGSKQGRGEMMPPQISGSQKGGLKPGKDWANAWETPGFGDKPCGKIGQNCGSGPQLNPLFHEGGKPPQVPESTPPKRVQKWTKLAVGHPDV